MTRTIAEAERHFRPKALITLAPLAHLLLSTLPTIYAALIVATDATHAEAIAYFNRPSAVLIAYLGFLPSCAALSATLALAWIFNARRKPMALALVLGMIPVLALQALWVFTGDYHAEFLEFALISLNALATPVILLISITTLVVAARRTRIAKGRCPSCSYDLRNLPLHAPCPECGAPPPRHPRGGRTRARVLLELIVNRSPPMLIPDDTANLSAHELRVRLLRAQAHRDIVMGIMVQLIAIIMMMGSVGNASALFPLPFTLIISIITLFSGFVFYYSAYRRDRHARFLRTA